MSIRIGARRVAGDDEPFVVDARVGVGAVVAKHGVDHAQELAGRGEDRSLVCQRASRNAVYDQLVILGIIG